MDTYDVVDLSDPHFNDYFRQIFSYSYTLLERRAKVEVQKVNPDLDKLGSNTYEAGIIQALAGVDQFGNYFYRPEDRCMAELFFAVYESSNLYVFAKSLTEILNTSDDSLVLSESLRMAIGCVFSSFLFELRGNSLQLRSDPLQVLVRESLSGVDELLSAFFNLPKRDFLNCACRFFQQPGVQILQRGPIGSASAENNGVEYLRGLDKKETVK